MKKFKSFLVVLTSLLFFSCSNLFDTGNSQKNCGEANSTGSVQVKVSFSIEGAVPEQLAASANSTSPNSTSENARTAGVDLTGLISSYTIIATDTTDSTKTRTNNISSTASSADRVIDLVPGEWNITVNGYDSEGNQILTGDWMNGTDKASVQIPYTTAPSIAVSLKPSLIGTGKVNLPINLSGTEIKSFKAEWGTSYSQKISSSIDLTTIYLTMKNGITQSNSDPVSVEAGSHTVKLTFYNDTNYSDAVFTCYEKINVFDNLTTNKWENSSQCGYMDNGDFKLTGSFLNGRNVYYVSKDEGDDSYEGSKVQPLETVQAAIDKIIQKNNGSNYTVYLLSNCEDSSFTEKGKISIVNDSTSQSLSITIKSYNEPGLASNKYSISGGGSQRVVYVNGNKSEVNLTFENIVIDDGHTNNSTYSDTNGAGIYSEGKVNLTLNSGVTIKDSTAYNGNGGGINYGAPEGYVFTMNEGVIVSGCTATFNGGNIFFSGDSEKYIKGGKIISGNQLSKNDGSCGGGICITQGTVEISGSTEISNNNCNGNGAGIAIPRFSTGVQAKVTIKDTVTITGNNAQGYYSNGGGIYLGLNITTFPKLTIESGVTISSNEAMKSGGGIACIDGGNVTVNGAKITNNIAGEYGGGIYISGTSSGVVLNSATIKDNTDDDNNNSNAVYNGNSLTLIGNNILTSSDFIGVLEDKKIQIDSKLTNSTKLNVFYYSSNPLGKQLLKGDGVASSYEKFSLESDSYEIDETGYLIEKFVPFSNFDEYPDNTNFTISNETELASFANKQFDDKIINIRLINDINLTGSNQSIQISPTFQYFKGTFNGKGHTISGFNSTKGLFGSLGESSKITNLVLRGSISGTISFGSILDKTEKDGIIIENCISFVDITGQGNIGGICGVAESNLTIKNCVNAGTITASQRYVGGILGKHDETEKTVSILNCANLGDISKPSSGLTVVSNYFAGICASTTSNDIIDNCYNIGTVTINDNNNNKAAIAGASDSDTSPAISNIWYKSDYSSTYNISSGITNAYHIENVDSLKNGLDNVVSTKSSDGYKSWIYTLDKNGTQYPICVNPVSSSSNVSMIGDKAAPDSVGDIVFSDGSATGTGGVDLTTDQKNAVVGVIFSTTYNFETGESNSNGMLMIGLHNSRNYTSSEDGWKNWCTSEVNGFNVIFNTSDTDGSGNWNIIKSADNANAGKVTGTYPVFEWAENYGTEFGLTGDYLTGWYIPSIKEMEELNSVCNIVNNALEKAWPGDVMDNYDLASSFFSSSQVKDDTIDEYQHKAKTYSFTNNYASEGYKDKGETMSSQDGNPQYVLVVRKVE